MNTNFLRVSAAGVLAVGTLLAALVVGTGTAATQAVPTNTQPPTIGGTPEVGKTLTAREGTWTGNPTDYAGFLWLWQGREPAGEYLAGFLIEKSLSIDNLLVFALIFAYFAVPPAFQRRALY